MIMTGVAKKKDDKKPARGELMEQNQDGLEYSSEEEVEGLEETMNKLTNETDVTYARKLGYRYGTNTLGIIFFCLTFGTVLGSLGRKAKVVISFFSVIDEVIMKMVYGIMW